MKNTITLSIFLLFFAGCYKDSGEVKPVNSLGPVYPEVHLEPEWIAGLEEDDFHYPQFMLETDHFLIYHINRSLLAIDINNGETVWVFDPAEYAYPYNNLSPSKHIFEYEGYLYFFAASASEVLKIDFNDGTLAEVIPLPARGPDKSNQLASFFNDGKLILHRHFHDFNNHHYSFKLFEFDLNSKQEKIVGEVASVLVVLGEGRPAFTDFDNNFTYFKSVIRHDTTTHMAVLFKFDLTAQTYEIVWSQPVWMDYANEEIFISHGNIYIPKFNNDSRFIVLDQNDYTLKWEAKSMHSHYYIEDNIFFYSPYGTVKKYDMHGNIICDIKIAAYLNGKGFDKDARYVFLTMNRKLTAAEVPGTGSFTSIYDAFGGQELIRINHPDNDSPEPRKTFIRDIFRTKDGKRLIMYDKANIYSYPWPEIL